jgi:iron complex outermembrane recepter protein
MEKQSPWPPVPLQDTLLYYHHTLLTFIVLVVVLVPPVRVAAQDAIEPTFGEMKILKEEETVSIAARHEQPISQAPSNVYVITDDDIRQSGATDIPTVLRRIPGIEVMQVTGADFNVSVRGNNQLQANKLLVMVDGRSIYLEGQGVVFWKLLPVTLPEIKRIEVVKGPSSSLYGFNAFDGVINIITKSPDELKGSLLQVGGGNYGTFTGTAIYAGRQGKFAYRLSAGHDQNQQWRNPDALAFRGSKLNIYTEYDMSSDAKLSVSGGVVESNRFDGPFISTVVTSSQPSQQYANLAYERQNFFVRGWWTGFSNTGVIQTNPLLGNLISATDRNGSSVNNERNDVYNIDTQHTIELGPSTRLSYGVNYRHITVSSNFLLSTAKQDRLGLFVENEWKIIPALTLVGGVRYDLHTVIKPTVSPRLALVYRPLPDHTFRVALAIGYRPPTPFETGILDLTNINLPSPLPSPPTMVLRGSQILSPEEIISYDAGYQGWFWKHRLRLRADIFFNHISNLIETRSPSPTTISFFNGPQADIYGGEIGVEFLVTRWLSGFANYSYQQIGQSITGEARRGAPGSKFNIGFRGEWENGLNGEAGLYHVGSATYPLSEPFTTFAPLGIMTPSTLVGSYSLVNVRLAYSIWHDTAEVAITGFNAFNDRHKEHPLGDTIGSRVMGWLTLKF